MSTKTERRQARTAVRTAVRTVLRELQQRYGSWAAVAEALSASDRVITRQGVYQWYARARVRPGWAGPVAELHGGVQPRDLCDDLDWMTEEVA